MNKNEKNVYSLDWGGVFVDSYNTKTKEAFTVLNFNFEAKDITDSITSYLIGYLFYLEMNIEKKSIFTIIFDLRGQKIDESELLKVEKEVTSKLKLKLKIIFNF